MMQTVIEQLECEIESLACVEKIEVDCGGIAIVKASNHANSRLFDAIEDHPSLSIDSVKTYTGDGDLMVVLEGWS